MSRRFNPLMLSDFYKTDHRRQYPEKTDLVYSNWTPRGSRIDGIDSVVVFGIQSFIQKWLIDYFNNEFFLQPKEFVISQYKRRLDNALGERSVPLDHIEALHNLGFLPIEIKALPEGTRCPMRVPMLTIKNTLPEFYWLTNFLETLMSAELWSPMTSATIAAKYREILDSYAEKTSDIPEFVQYQGHDFSMRGMCGVEAAAASGAGHLLSFVGSDTIPAIDYLEYYYGADSGSELIGCSVPATEHSVMCMGGIDDEIGTFEDLIFEVYPKGIISVVSDTWDFWKVLTEYLPKLKEGIMKRDGKVVIRPDSGDPVDIICGAKYDGVTIGSPEYKGAIQVLWDVFGGTINSKGYMQLDEHIGLIYGDAITLDRCREICQKLESQGFASTNVVFGIGSFTYQYNTRDTFGFAMKATYGVVDGKPMNIFKDPKTDDGLKKSAKGLLCVLKDDSGNYVLHDEVNETEENCQANELKTVFNNGSSFNLQSLDQIRSQLCN